MLMFVLYNTICMPVYNNEQFNWNLNYVAVDKNQVACILVYIVKLHKDAELYY